jgi:hypothetical protein
LVQEKCRLLIFSIKFLFGGAMEYKQMFRLSVLIAVGISRNFTSERLCRFISFQYWVWQRHGKGCRVVLILTTTVGYEICLI